MTKGSFPIQVFCFVLQDFKYSLVHIYYIRTHPYLNGIAYQRGRMKIRTKQIIEQCNSFKQKICLNALILIYDPKHYNIFKSM